MASTESDNAENIPDLHDCEKNEQEQSTRRNKRKQLGRASRRRKAKLRAIEQAEQSLWKQTGCEITTHQEDVTSLVPTDRDKVWPGVCERRKDRLDEKDENDLIGQLGYLPGNAVEITRADHIASLPLAKAVAVSRRGARIASLPFAQNTPIVLKLYPLTIRHAYAGGKTDGRKFKGRKRGGPDSHKEETPIEEGGKGKKQKVDDSILAEKQEPLLEPFPTLYWLTHPMLKTLVSKLELGETHNVRLMEERLEADKDAMESMKRAHKAYGKERWELLTETDHEVVKARKWQGALGSERGVAGIRKHNRIKCLHTHAAHYLSGGKGSSDNIVGKWTMDAVFDLIRQHDDASGTESNQSESDNK